MHTDAAKDDAGTTIATGEELANATMGVGTKRRTRDGECDGNVTRHHQYSAAFEKSVRHEYEHTD